MEQLLAGIDLAVSWVNILMMLFGVIVGVTFGAIPGLTFITGIVLVLPLTFALEPIEGISLLLGVYCGGMAGGAVSAILLGIPGTPSAAATLIDGHKLAQKGEPGKALGMALFASVFGGIVSLIILSLVAPQVARIAIKFGPVEIFALVILGFSTICRVSESNLVKGLISGTIGLMITTVGLDPVMGVQRYTFDQTFLINGIGLLPVLIGIFALPEIVSTICKKGIRTTDKIKSRLQVKLPTFKEFKENLSIIFKSALIGTGIGAIPGSSGPIACFLAYDQAKRNSKNPEKFGTGSLEGIAAPEAANNAVSGGVMIPLLTLGIPGDTASAVIMGALLIHGLQPGPMLFRDTGDLIFAIFASLFIINLLILFVQYFGIKLFVKVLKVPRLQLNAVILALTVIGSFATHLNYFDVFVMVGAGFLGYALLRSGFPVTPLLLGTVLGGIIEDNFRRSLIISKGDPTIFFTRPISLIVLLFTLLVLFGPEIQKRFSRYKQKTESR